jgi:excisionase family DNA binding protein
VCEPIEQTPRAAYSVPEVCELLGVSKDWLRRQIAAGNIRAVRMGSRVFVPRDEIQKFAAGEIGEPYTTPSTANNNEKITVPFTVRPNRKQRNDDRKRT